MGKTRPAPSQPAFLSQNSYSPNLAILQLVLDLLASICSLSLRIELIANESHSLQRKWSGIVGEKVDWGIGKAFEEKRLVCLTTKGAEEAEKCLEMVVLLMADWWRYLRDLTELAFHIFISNLSRFSGFL